eukprot:scaffold68316_cov59-Phaeocystis_antarctica.AAC.5
MGLPKARGPQSIQIEALRMPRAYCSKLQATRTDLFFGAGDKQGARRLRCHRLSCRAHIAALSLELLGISHHVAAASHEEESPEARRFGYGYIDTGSRQRAKSGGVSWRFGAREVARGYLGR